MQRWSDLLFAHWPVNKMILKALIHSSLTLDQFDETAWVSITPFGLTHFRPRYIPPFPWISSFPELNVRTYVVRDGKPGVYFFRLDVGRYLAALGGRVIYHLPYMHAKIKMVVSQDGTVTYNNRGPDHGNGPALFRADYRAVGPTTVSRPGTLDYWLTERYCLYSVSGTGQLYRADIHHRPWSLQSAEADIYKNTMARSCGIPLEGPPKLSFSECLDVVIWFPQPCSL